MPRLAFTEPSIGSTTTHGRIRARARRTELLRDEHEVLANASSRATASSAAAVDRRRVVAALAGAQNRLALARFGSSASDVVDIRDAARQVSSQSVIAGWKSKPERSFGKKYVLFGGITSPARRPLEDVLDTASGGAGTQPRLAVVDAA